MIGDLLTSSSIFLWNELSGQTDSSDTSIGKGGLAGVLRPYNSNQLPETGDEVWILFGCSVPVVLRKCETRMEFEEGEDGPGATGNDVYAAVGYAVLEGAMRGDCVKGISPDGVAGPDYHGSPIIEIDIA